MSKYSKPVSYAVAVGTPVVVDMRNGIAPMTITALPGAGGTIAVEVSTSPNAVDADASLPAATWRAWALGTVAAAASDTLLGPISALRLTAATQAGRVEVVS